jgi:hypothetical protein
MAVHVAERRRIIVPPLGRVLRSAADLLLNGVSLDAFVAAERAALGVSGIRGDEEGDSLIVITCLTPSCLTTREVVSTNTFDVGACPECHSLGWTFPLALARDERWWLEHPLPEPRLSGSELRAALVSFFPPTQAVQR